MTGPQDFEFAIVGVDDTADAFKSVDKRAKQTAGHAEQASKALGRHAKQAKTGLASILAPARALSPELDRAASSFARFGKAGALLGAAFRPETVTRTGAAFRAAGHAAQAAGQSSIQAGQGAAAMGAEIAAAGTASQGLAGALGAASDGMAGFGGAALTGLGGVAALGAAFVGAEIAAAKFISPFARGGQQIKITADTIGMAADQLQAFRGASELAGVSADATTGALAGLAETMHKAQYGMDAGAINALRLAGIKTPARGEKLDVGAAALQAADAIRAQNNPQSQATLASILGMSAALPFLRQGSGAIRRDQAQYRASGDIYSASDLDKSASMSRSLTGFNQASHGAAKNLAMAGVGLDRPGVDIATGTLSGLGHQADAAASALARLGGVARRIVTPAYVERPYVPGAAMRGRPAGGSAMRGPSAAALGLRQNNPGNLRSWGNTPVVGGFASFPSMEAGLEAASKNLLAKQTSHHLNTMAEIIGDPRHGWAPAADRNDVPAYLADLERTTGFKRDQRLDLTDPHIRATLLGGIITHEQGKDPFSPAQLLAASTPVAAVSTPAAAASNPANVAKMAAVAPGGDERRSPQGGPTGSVDVRVVVDAPANTRIITSSQGAVALKVARSAGFLGG